MAALVCVIMTCNIRVREGLKISTVFHSDSFVDDDLDDTDGDDLDDKSIPYIGVAPVRLFDDNTNVMLIIMMIMELKTVIMTILTLA